MQNKKKKNQPNNAVNLQKNNNDLGNENQRLKNELKKKEAEVLALKNHVQELQTHANQMPVAVVDDFSDNLNKMMDSLVNLQNNQSLNKIEESQTLVKVQKQFLDNQLDYLKKEQEIISLRPEVVTAKQEKKHKLIVTMVLFAFGLLIVTSGLIYCAMTGGFNWLTTVLIVMGGFFIMMGYAPHIDATDADKLEKVVKSFNLIIDKVGLPKNKNLLDNKDSDTE